MPRPPKQFKAKPFEFHQILTLTIESLSNQGDGVAKIDIPEQSLAQWVIFIPFTIPGESVSVRITQNHKNCSHAELVEIISPSPHRREPRCRFYTLCGGCQYQHIDYPTQLEQKASQIKQLLQHLAGVDFPVNPTIGSPREFNYRSKITPHFRFPKKGKISAIGFAAKAKQRDYLDIYHCDIAMEEINAALPAIRKSTFHSAKTYKCDHTLLLRVAEGRVETSPNNAICETVNGINFHFLASDFFQNNPFILPEFVDYAAKQSKLESTPSYLIDAYCGSGLFALSLAHQFTQVAGVEISPTATDWAKNNARLNHIDNSTFIDGKAEAIFDGVDFPPAQTTILVDPPRAGCSSDFLDQLFNFSPRKVIYISCDPATQIRDLRHFLDHGYRIDDVQPFDLFPQTKHLECIISMSRDSSS